MQKKDMNNSRLLRNNASKKRLWSENFKVLKEKIVTLKFYTPKTILQK